ncbi:sn-glycerol-3-phosphate ABC transporter ATP-binding protein UgpC [Tissierella sp. MB52-C2]|uniref:ABC transporter ATP-binding protein n=1 Tax=Tissierella sp. MB52-C2 TaxID=3070999 RepID=UPI00280B706F|nr:sn-glycerol-3-phosphate ABC transporter ATP-binding protein UgpC [Tissierella sp. MB52-C2]WMM26074.1 sn-glycerol-3-phosphate ABC transporter ATP-binding protein UgpC [Tissierella sp. MB52-C2]
MAELELKQINKIYDNGFHAVKDFNLKIEEREFIVLVGPSGCGKTTVLRMIAGFENITDGELYMDDSLMNHMAAKDRDIAMVFQNHALFPHLTVYENISFPLKINKLSKKEIHNKVKTVADILDVEPLLDKKPNTLSGGQKQRVALGRAIVRNPKVFLMDEPLSNLDSKLRTQMRIEISKLYRKLDATFIYVTHDQTEAMTMGTRVVIMENGKIHQVGIPQEVYEKPNDIFVARFIGSPSMNVFDGTIVINEEEVQLKVYIGKYNDDNMIYLKLPESKQKILQDNNYINKAIKIGIRPENIRIRDKEHSNILKAYVSMVETIGLDTYIYFDIDDENCVIKTNIDNKIRIGDNISFYINKEKIHLFDYETSLRIF